MFVYHRKQIYEVDVDVNAMT